MFTTVVVFSILLCLTGCRSVRQASNTNGEDKSRAAYLETARKLLEAPSVTELTSPADYAMSGTRVGGQVRMRRDQSIQLGVTVLIAEVARVEFLPDKAVIADRIHNKYSVCHYADIPYRNELGLGFDVIQAMLWNRMFVPGYSDVNDAISFITDIDAHEDGTVTYKESEYGYMFKVNADGELVQTGKTVSSYSFRIDYSNRLPLASDCIFPKSLAITLTTPSRTINATLEMTSPSTQIRTWANETPVSSRLKRVTIEELLDGLNL